MILFLVSGRVGVGEGGLEVSTGENVGSRTWVVRTAEQVGRGDHTAHLFGGSAVVRSEFGRVRTVLRACQKRTIRRHLLYQYFSQHQSRVSLSHSPETTLRPASPPQAAVQTANLKFTSKLAANKIIFDPGYHQNISNKPLCKLFKDPIKLICRDGSISQLQAGIESGPLLARNVDNPPASIFSMFIDAPSFVHRKIMNSKNEASPEDPSYKFGTQRNQLIKYVTSALSKHEKDEQILEKFRREAEELKRRKFQSKRKANDYPLTKKSTNQNLPPIPSINVSAFNEEQKSRDLTSPKNNSQYISSKHEKELENVLQHQNDLVQKYRKLLEVKQKQLKHKNKKLQRHKYTLQKMSQKIKYLEKEQYLVKKEEQVQLTHMQNILKQLNTQLVQNKSSIQNQLTSMRRQPKSIWEANLSTDNKSKDSFTAENHQQSLKKPTKNQLQFIKRKAKSLKHENQARIIRSPTVLYSKIPTEESNEVDSPRSGNYLTQLNKSIIKQSKFRNLMGEENKIMK